MISMDRQYMGITTRTIWLSEYPFDIEDLDSVCFYACPNRVDMPGFQREDRATMIIDLTKDIDGIWSNIGQKCRSNIKRAEKEGIEVTMNSDHQRFIDLNEGFRSVKGLDHNTLPVDFIKEKGTLFLARSGGEMVSGILFLADEKRMLGVLAASRRLEAEQREKCNIANANRLLWWSAIKHAKERGLETFDMGGYYVGGNSDPELEGINEFKRRFGGEVVESFAYKKDYTLKIKMVHSIQGQVGRLGRLRA